MIFGIFKNFLDGYFINGVYMFVLNWKMESFDLGCVEVFVEFFVGLDEDMDYVIIVVEKVV